MIYQLSELWQDRILYNPSSLSEGYVQAKCELKRQTSFLCFASTELLNLSYFLFSFWEYKEDQEARHELFNFGGGHVGRVR